MDSTEQRAPHFHANTHQPGYLPMADEVPTFDAAGDAWAYLAGELERAWDSEYDGVPDGDAGAEERLAIDGRYLDAHTHMHNAPSEPGSEHVDGPTDTHLGVVYEVTACAEDHTDDPMYP